MLLVVSLALGLGACVSGSPVVAGRDAAVPDLGVDLAVVVDVQDVQDVRPDLGMDVQDVQDVPVDLGMDVMPRCATDADCAGDPAGNRVCDAASGRCVQCLAARDTCPPDRHCVEATRTCAPGCRSDEGCAAGLGADAGSEAGVEPRYCLVARNTCVRCVMDAHCPAGMLCTGNVCAAGCNPMQPCPAGQACCGGACVDPSTNVAHCGACDTRCMLANGTPACVAGACAVGTCADGFADCNTLPGDGCETDTTTAAAHCGRCGNACVARPNGTVRCVLGRCEHACSPGFADCNGRPDDGCEVNLQTDPTHCGSCANLCNPPNATPGCALGRCTIASCNPGFADCDANATSGCEVDTRADVSHCGMCGRACPVRANSMPGCVASACVNGCFAGFAECDGRDDNGCEVDTRTDPAHCGMCARACRTPRGTPSCVASACRVGTCEAGFADCDGMASTGCEVETATSAAHCGRCGNACGSGERCVAGVCGAATSCQSLRAATPALPSGSYVIDPDGPGGAAPFRAYCDMTGDGGGWTLVLMAASTPAGTFGYSAGAWTDTSTVNPAVTDVGMNVNVKSPAFNGLGFTAMRFCLGSLTACLVEPATAPSARALFARGETLGMRSVADFRVWGYAGNLGCNRIGFNVVDPGDSGGTHARCRYAILLNNESACEGSVDGGRGFGCRGYYGTQISAGQGDGIVSTSHERGWIFVR